MAFYVGQRIENFHGMRISPIFAKRNSMVNSRARETTEAIERIYVSMRHLFYRGFSNLEVFPEKHYENF